MITVIAQIHVRPGKNHRQAVLDAFAKIIPAVLKEEGCHGYVPMVDHDAKVAFQTTAPDIITMVEKWDSVAHLEAHLAAPHMLTHKEAVKNDVVDVKIFILEEGIK